MKKHALYALLFCMPLFLSAYFFSDIVSGAEKKDSLSIISVVPAKWKTDEKVIRRMEPKVTITGGENGEPLVTITDFANQHLVVGISYVIS